MNSKYWYNVTTSVDENDAIKINAGGSDNW